MKTFFFIVPILMFLVPFRTGAQAAIIPSMQQEGIIHYYDAETGTFRILNTSQSDDEIKKESVGSVILEYRISPDGQKALVQSDNTPPARRESVFYDPSRAIGSANWWIYDFTTQSAQIMSSDITNAQWLSNADIIYVFQDREVATTSADNLSEFNVIYSGEQQLGADQNIFVYRSSVAIPYAEGIFFWDSQEVRKTEISGFNRSLTNDDRHGALAVVVNNTVQTYSIERGQKIDTFAEISSVVGMALTREAVVLQSSARQLTIIDTATQEQQSVQYSQDILSIHSAVRDSILLELRDRLVLYQPVTGQEQAVRLIGDQSQNGNITNNTSPGETNSIVALFPLIGGVILILGAIGYLVYSKVRKR